MRGVKLLLIGAALVGCSQVAGPPALPRGMGDKSVPGPRATPDYKVLYRFSSLPDANSPTTDLVLVPNSSGGLLYGTSFGGGLKKKGSCSHGCGTVYSIDPRSGDEHVLYRFEGGTDGAIPQAGLNPNAGNKLYGTTFFGGSAGPSCYIGRGCGTIFDIGVSAPTSYQVAYRFSGRNDGSNPVGGRHFIGSVSGGTFYGTTEYGGSHNFGTVYSFSTTDNSVKLLHSFMGAPRDGAYPVGEINATGCPTKCKFYGVTREGGSSNVGAIFELTQGTSAYKSVILHSFTVAEGDEPVGVELSPSGNQMLYGAASRDGANNRGSIFSYSLKNKTFAILHSFTGSISGNDGALPYARPILYGGNVLYGTTQGGGARGDGTVYEIKNLNGNPKECVIHSFPDPSVPEGDGVRPDSPLREFKDLGNVFYGTTVQGPQGSAYDKGYGTVFQISPNAPCQSGRRSTIRHRAR